MYGRQTGLAGINRLRDFSFNIRNLQENRRMFLGFTTCTEMSMNGARIGGTVAIMELRMMEAHGEVAIVRAVFCVAVTGTGMPGTAALGSAVTARRGRRATVSVSA